MNFVSPVQAFCIPALCIALPALVRVLGPGEICTAFVLCQGEAIVMNKVHTDTTVSDFMVVGEFLLSPFLDSVFNVLNKLLFRFCLVKVPPMV